MVDINQIKQWAISRWMLGEKHGISHWERVERNGLLLATPECDVTVIRLFAYLHDSCREDDSYDEEHGPRAAKMIEGLRETLLKDLSDEQFRMLQEACRLHTSTRSTGNPTIDACFDADRLDLGRVSFHALKRWPPRKAKSLRNAIKKNGSVVETSLHHYLYNASHASMDCRCK